MNKQTTPFPRTVTFPTYSLSDLPLVGDALAAIESITLNLDPFTAPPVTGTIVFGNTSDNFSLTAPPGTDTVVYNVQQSFGPLSLTTVTLQYVAGADEDDPGSLVVGVNGSLALKAFTVDLAGLTMTIDLGTAAKSYALNGLGIDYSVSPLTIAGALINMTPGSSEDTDFAGALTLGCKDFTVEIYGYYGNDQGFPSMFLFADLVGYDFGGPPAFSVQGAALGFGYNTSLTIPTVDQVSGFPFITLLQDGGTPPDPMKMLGAMLDPNDPSKAWIQQQPGAWWGSAGINFTTFKQINSSAVLVVEDASELLFSLVGQSTAQFPPSSTKIPPIAYVELDLAALLAPGDGVFSLEAVLSKKSFLLDPNCVLTGGFAFDVWFGSNPHAGDFVVTIGGYNPGFTAPSYYPSVKQVGFDWAIDSSISISGGVYFALTPAALMAGGALSATYQSGNLKAWFDAHADMLIGWKPVTYDVGIGISVGASYLVDLLFTTTTVSVELGCDLELWGPPTGGTVSVDWSIISFSIPFGSGSRSGQSTDLLWSDVEGMLPGGSSSSAAGDSNFNPIAISAIAGITPSNATTGSAGGSWLVRPSQFSFQTSTPIPASSVTFNGASLPTGNSSIDVYPMGQSGVSVSHTVTMQLDSDASASVPFQTAVDNSSVPSALWGKPVAHEDQPPLPGGSGQLVPNQTTGLTVSVPPPQVGSSAGQALLANLENNPIGKAGLLLEATPSGPRPLSGRNTLRVIRDGIASKNVKANRDAIYAALGTYQPPKNDAMLQFPKDIGCAFAAEPLLVA